MSRDISAKYDLRVPRYTSYPTSPHFHGGIDGETYGKWLAEISPQEELSLYLHIAYCAEMCWFCGCHTKITKRYTPIEAYMKALLAEIDLVTKHLPTRMTAKHVHFGGGSPTILNSDDFVRLVDTLREKFIIRPDAEIAVELDPRTADEEYVMAMARAGVTRASIGVQDFNEKVQHAINRIQPYDVTANVINWLRKHGVPEINMDLVYGLPYQTVESLMETLDKAHGFKPRRIALFGYAHVPWMKKHMRLIPEESLPNNDERWAQYEAATKRLDELGYMKIGLDHFAAPDDSLAIALRQQKLNRNFQGYTTDTANVLLGFGASGIGNLPSGYAVNNGEIHAYQAAVAEGKLPISRGIAISQDDKVRREIIMSLMCDLEVDVAEICRLHNADPAQFAKEFEALAELQSDDLVVIDGYHISVTEQGRTVVRLAASVFDTYLKKGEQRHSKAV